MSSWKDVYQAAPELGRKVESRFRSHPHHVLATIRRDGSPRVSGINTFFDRGELWFGSMPGTAKIADLVRDSRLALHSAPISEQLLGGDARISGRARVLSDRESRDWLRETQGNDQPGVVALVDVTELTLVEIEGDEMVITSWDIEKGVRAIRRR